MLFVESPVPISPVIEYNSSLVTVTTRVETIYRHKKYAVHLKYQTKSEGSGSIKIHLRPDFSKLIPGDEDFKLYQNYPNPFRNNTTVNYDLEKEAQVNLSVYNVKGQEVYQLVNDVQEPGKHSVTFDGSSLASGVYILRMMAGKEVVGNKKMVLIK